MSNPEVKIRLSLDGAQQVQAGVDQSAEKLLKLEKASADVATAQARLEAATQKAAAAQEALAKASNFPNTPTKYLTDLQTKVTTATAAVQQATVRSKEAQAALAALGQGAGAAGQQVALSGHQVSQVSAQLQDFFVQIQGGQAPLTAFLQQGSQMSAVFGGVGNAARAVVSLVTPAVAGIGLLGGALLAVGVGYAKGSAEAQEFNKTLLLTGNAAGTTTNQLMEMAGAIRASGGATQARAAEILNQLAGSGKVAAENLQRFTQAAIQLERVGGPAAEETAKAFADLAKSPAEAALKLNESTNFLTASTYKQIAALTELGRTSDAAKVAQEAYASAIEQRTPALEKNLGSIERLWLGIKDATKAAGDALLDIGRKETLQTLSTQISALERRRDILAGGNADQKSRAVMIDAELEPLRAQLVALRDIETWTLRGAAAEQQKAESTKASADALALLKQYGVENVSLAEQEAALRERLVAGGIKQAKIEEAIAAFRERNKDKGTPGNAFAGEQASAEQWAQAYVEFGRAVSEADAQIKGLTKSEAKLQELQQKGLVGVPEGLQKMVEARAKDAIGAEKQIENYKKLYAEQQRIAKAADAYTQQLNDIANANSDAEQMTNDYTRSLDNNARRLELEASMLGASASARSLAVAQLNIELELERKILDVKKLKAADEVKEVQIAALRVQAGRDQLQAIIRSQTSELSGVIEAVEGTARRVWTDVSNGGQDAFKRVGNTLKASVLDLLYQLTIKKWVVNITANMLGLTTQAAATSAAGGVASTALGGAVATAAPYVAGALAIASIVKSLDNSGTVHTGGSSAYSAAQGLSTGAGLYGVGSRAGAYSTQTETLTTQITQSIVGILDSTATAFGKQAGFSAAAAFADDSSKDGAWGALAIRLGDQLVAGFGVDGNGKWPGKGFADGQAGSEQYLAAVSADVRSALNAIGLPEWAKSLLDKLGDAPALETLSKTVAEINAIQATLANLGKSLPQIAGLTSTAVQKLVESFGGSQGLSTALDSYYQSFYSEAERNAAATEQVTAALQKLGYTMPATREQFRGWVDEQLKLGDAGIDTATNLLKLQDAVASLVPATEAATTAVDNLAEQMAASVERTLKQLTSQGDSLMVDLLTAQGDTAGAAALRRQLDLSGLLDGITGAGADAITALYDKNKGIQDQLEALKKAASDQAAADQRATAVATERTTLEGRLLQLQGNTAELRARELAGLDATNRAIQENIYALEDQQAAVQRVNGALSSLDSAYTGQQIELLNLQGKSAEAAALKRASDLAGLTAGMNEADAARVAAAYDRNQALQQEIEQTRAAQQAAEAIARAQEQAAETAARASEQFKSAWQSASDTLFDEAAKISGLITADSPASLATAQANFAIATGQAKAGDQDATKKLPELARLVVELGKNQAGSQLELDRLRAAVAASLEDTGRSLSSTYGLSIPKLATGTNYVPRDMLAFLHEGESVQPRQYNPAAGGGADSELIAEVKAMRAEIAALKDASQRTAKATEGTKDVLVKTTRNGEAMQVETAS